MRVLRDVLRAVLNSNENDDDDGDDDLAQGIIIGYAKLSKTGKLRLIIIKNYWTRLSKIS